MALLRVSSHFSRNVGPRIQSVVPSGAVLAVPPKERDMTPQASTLSAMDLPRRHVVLGMGVLGGIDGFGYCYYYIPMIFSIVMVFFMFFPAVIVIIVTVLLLWLLVCLLFLWLLHIITVFVVAMMFVIAMVLLNKLSLLRACCCYHYYLLTQQSCAEHWFPVILEALRHEREKRHDGRRFFAIFEWRVHEPIINNRLPILLGWSFVLFS